MLDARLWKYLWCVAVLFGHRADAAIVQIDVRAVLDADVIVNNGAGLDPTQQSIDMGLAGNDNFALLTQSAAVALAIAPQTPNGLPDDGSFAGTAFHPDVQLNYDNADDGNNARRIPGPANFSFAVPVALYRELHLFFTSGDGDGLVDITLTYADSSMSVTAVVIPDWFDDPAETSDVYRLFDGGDRVQPGSGPGVPYAFEDPNDTAITGCRIVVDPTRLLASVAVTRTDTTGVLSFFGATADSITRGVDLFQSADKTSVVVPQNLVATGITSPHDHVSAVAPALFFQADDGLGTPSPIWMIKTVVGVRVVF